LGQLSNLRSTLSSIPNAMISTYTYKPLIGVSTIIDARQEKITYEYDDFGRLKSVKDKNNNILTENEYHIKPQN
jgi:YD repeat-containing protein